MIPNGDNRRHFLRALGAAGAATLLGWKGDQPRRSLAVDGLGEIHPHYDPALLDEILASGLRGCVVTVGNPALQGATAFDNMKADIDTTNRHIAANPTRLSRANTAADIRRAAERQTIALMYYTQNASPIGDDIAKLDTLHALGVRIVQLTYNTRNLLGDGCLERTNSGLSNFGLQVVSRMNDMRMLADASHCGEATTRDAIMHSKAPIAITHSACRAVFEHPRGKTDETMRLLADRGGVIGIFQINPYLGAKERNTLDDYLLHIEHAIRVAGIEHVAIGSDREHRRIPDTPEEKQKLIDELSRLRPLNAANFRWPFFIAELNGPRRMDVIASALAKRGRPAAEIDKLLGGNWLRLFADTLA